MFHNKSQKHENNYKIQLSHSFIAIHKSHSIIFGIISYHLILGQIIVLADYGSEIFYIETQLNMSIGFKLFATISAMNT